MTKTAFSLRALNPASVATVTLRTDMDASIGQRSDREVADTFAHPLEREIEIGGRHGERQTQMPGATRPEVGAGQDRHPVRFEQARGELARRQSRSLFDLPHVREGVERTGGPRAADAGEAIQP